MAVAYVLAVGADSLSVADRALATRRAATPTACIASGRRQGYFGEFVTISPESRAPEKDKLISVIHTVSDVN